MSNPKDIVSNSLEYLDKNVDNYKELISKIKYYSLEFFFGDLERHKIIFYDKNKKKIFNSDYEIIGLYNNFSRTWAWSWSISWFSKNEVYLARKILNYGLDIVPDRNTLFLKTALVTSRFRITDFVQLDLHVAIASYLGKQPLIYQLYVHPSASELVDAGVIPIYEKEQSDENYQIFYLFLLDSENLVKFK